MGEISVATEKTKFVDLELSNPTISKSMDNCQSKGKYKMKNSANVLLPESKEIGTRPSNPTMGRVTRKIDPSMRRKRQEEGPSSGRVSFYLNKIVDQEK